MAFFDKYFIGTPIFKKQQIQVDKADFYNISDDKRLILELAPHSQTTYILPNNGEEIT